MCQGSSHLIYELAVLGCAERTRILGAKKIAFLLPTPTRFHQILFKCIENRIHSRYNIRETIELVLDNSNYCRKCYTVAKFATKI